MIPTLLTRRSTPLLRSTGNYIVRPWSCQQQSNRVYSRFRIPRKRSEPIVVTVAPKRSASLFSPPVRIAGPVLFGITASATAFVVAAIVYDRNQVTFWQRLRKRSSWLRNTDELPLKEYVQAKQAWIRERRQEIMERARQRLEQLDMLPRDLVRAYLIVVDKLASLTDAERTLWALIGINLTVFGFWQFPRMLPFMTKWFTHNPASKNSSITLVTSCFSHQEIFHLMLNMMGLYSFGMVIHQHLGREQFLASYLGMGIGANVASHVLSIATRRYRPIMPSLGASGAIYGLLAGTAYLYPNSSVSLIFLPFIPIKMGYALPAMMGFDLAGILLGWRRFDHYAHLAGAGLGVYYMHYGPQHIWQPLVRKVHEIRGNGNKDY
ncbi:hypothetical protein INT45_007755 [Circinella minor]|uniref:Peptidase S54 rhomboid domain-containing protein n=1 Tax=Circinella minor TaxID=1195481 RepID=A0A8H7S2X7_9FUNG|nr:hypothetical protein INT45_007755 [Circinella minor]